MKIGILSDIHGNLPALKTVYRYLIDSGCDKIICLGDVVGYIPSFEALNFLYEKRDDFIFIKGNHEDLLLSELALDKIYCYDFLRNNISIYMLDFIKSWPYFFEFNGIDFIHSIRDLSSQYIRVYKDTDLDFSRLSKITFIGHSHYSFVRSNGEKYLISVGSIGAPRDFGGISSFAIFDTDNNTLDLKKINLREESLEYVSMFEDVDDKFVSGFFRNIENEHEAIDERYYL